ncbi:MAG: hypothetical protein HOP23_03210 [Methylococcaceae bacterium]|nr:hypothetical protein [Methylococcaceae bacterium]
MTLTKKDFGVNQDLPWRVMVVFLVIHLLMFAYDVTHPEVFLNADRAIERWGTSQHVALALSKGDSIDAEFLLSNGLGGDYLFHGLLFFLIGKDGLIIFQILLTLFSGYTVYGIARFWGFTTGVAATTSTIYLALPHTLIFPHQLSTEAIHCPLLVISLWLLVRFLDQQKNSFLAGSAIALGLATFARPITLLWAVVPTLVLFLSKKITPAIQYFLLAFLPILVWMLFMLANTGHFTMGEGSRDLRHHLYNRIGRISDTMDIASASHVREEFLTQGKEGSISPQQYLRFVIDHPIPVISQTIRDTLVFAFKSGIERITIDYFVIGNVDRKFLQADSAGGWRPMFEKKGMVTTIMFMLETQGLILLISLVGAMLMAALTLLALLGSLRMIVDWRLLNSLQRSMAIVITALPFYIWVFSQVVNALQSRNRAPAEAAIVLLAAYGAIWLRDRWLAPERKRNK